MSDAQGFWDIVEGDAAAVLATLPADSVQTCITSPPYWGLRDYGVAGQLGLEKTPEEYVARMVEVFREVKRVLRPDGTLWLNLGDSYAGAATKTTGRNDPDFNERTRERYGKWSDAHGYAADQPKALLSVKHGLKPKDLVGIPWRVAFALQSDGWYLRSDIVWHKPNPMPESVTDRPTKAHEYVFLLTKSERYLYDADAIREPHTSIPEGKTNDPDAWKRGPATEREGRPGHLDSLGVANRPSDYFGHALGRNRRSVWTITTKPFSGAHFAVMPWDLVEPCVLAGSRPGDTVLDPFAGSGTVGMVSRWRGRNFVGVELNPEYAAMARARILTDEPKRKAPRKTTREAA